MRKLSLIFIFLIYCIIDQSAGKDAEPLIDDESILDPLIVGGNDARLGQFPYFVSIRFGVALSHGCGVKYMIKIKSKKL